MNLTDLVSAKEISVYWTGTASNKMPYLGEILFPPKKQLGLDLSYIKGSQGLPVALAPASFNADAPIRERIGISEVKLKMAFFRERMVIDEEERQKLLLIAGSNNYNILRPVIEKIYDDASALIDGVNVNAERMRMQLLSGATIKVLEKRGAYDYKYPFKSSHKIALTGTSRWSDTANSNPVRDIIEWQDFVEDETGNRPTRAICSRKTWGYLMDNENIKKDMNVQNGLNIIMDKDTLLSYFIKKTGLAISVYNKKYALSLDGASQQFFPDNVFTLLPAGTLGTTWFGTTPEEADLLSSDQSRAKVEIVNTGVAVTSRIIEHPVNSETIVSAICLPSFEAADSILIATVA